MVSPKRGYASNRAKIFLLTLFCSVLLACGSGSDGTNPNQELVGNVDQRIYNWKLVTTWPKNLPALGTAPVRFAERVRIMSGGRLNIKVYAAGELVPAFGVFDAVSQGNAWRSASPSGR